MPLVLTNNTRVSATLIILNPILERITLQSYTIEADYSNNRP